MTKNRVEYLSLDPSYIDTAVVREIGIDKDLKSLLIKVNDNLTVVTINLADYAEKTIKPLRRNLNELLVGNKSKQLIINSVITTVNRNLHVIKRICQTQKNESNECPIDRDLGANARSTDAQLLLEFASRKENTELFFKNQYGEHYVAVRLGKDKHLEIMPIKSEKYKYYLAKLFHENFAGRIIDNDTISNAINVMATKAQFDGERRARAR